MIEQLEAEREAAEEAEAQRKLDAEYEGDE